MESNILGLLGIPNIDPNRHYWIIRTSGGKYYQDFTLHQYISIAWDHITLNILNNENEDAIKRLIGVYIGDKEGNIGVDIDDEETDGSLKAQVTSIYNKIHRFVFEISQGDIVLIPSANSDLITIAEVIGNAYENLNYAETYLLNDPDSEIIPCPYYKRRKIRSLKTIEKNKMDIYLLKGFNSQHALSNMDDYAPYIDRTIYGVYSKAGAVHTTLYAGHPYGLSLKELVLLSSIIEESASCLAQQCDIPFDSSEIEVKLNIHSPGLIELIGAASGMGIVISLLIFSINNLVNGGKLSISLKKDKENNKLDFSINSETAGLKGHSKDEQRLKLEKKAELLEIISKLNLKSPELISSILNDEEITPDMIAEAQKHFTLPSNSEDTVK